MLWKAKSNDKWVTGELIQWRDGERIRTEDGKRYKIDKGTLCKPLGEAYATVPWLIYDRDIVIFEYRGKKYYGEIVQDKYFDFWVKCHTYDRHKIKYVDWFNVVDSMRPVSNTIDNPKLIYEEVE